MEVGKDGSGSTPAPDLKEMKKKYDTMLKKQVDTTQTITFVSFARLLCFGSKTVWRDTRV